MAKNVAAMPHGPDSEGGVMVKTLDKRKVRQIHKIQLPVREPLGLSNI